MDKTLNVHMLPSDTYSTIVINNLNKLEYFGVEYYPLATLTQAKKIPQHLYLTSLSIEDLKDGDHVIYNTQIAGEPNWVCIKVTNEHLKAARLLGYQKVVATTNQSMWLMSAGSNYKGPVYNIGIIPPSFVEEFVKQQGDIKQVKVKYEGDNEDLQRSLIGMPPLSRPMLTSNGEVIITTDDISDIDKIYEFVRTCWSRSRNDISDNAYKIVLDELEKYRKVKTK